MALNTIYMLRHIQSWLDGGKKMENVYFFDHTAGTGEAAALATSFGIVFLPVIRALQCQTVKDVSIDVINLGDLGDFTSVPVSGMGVYVGQVLPPHSALSFTTKLSTRAVRHGGHRISGIPESVNEAGKILDPTYVGQMEDYRDLLKTELVDATETWKPVVIKRVRTAVPGKTPTQYTYRLPETDGELVVGEIVNALLSLNISHQVSREV